MVMPQDLLSDLAAIEGPIANVRNAVDRVIDPNGDGMRVGEAQTGVEEATEAWLVVTEQLEARLLQHARVDPSEQAAIGARLGAMAMLHTAVACDVALLGSLDRMDESALVGPAFDPRLAESAGVVHEAAFGEGRLVEALSMVDDEEPIAFSESEPFGDEDVDEVVKDLVKRAGRCATAVLGGLAGGLADLAFSRLAPSLRIAADMTPKELRAAVQGLGGRITHLVGRLLTRIDALWGAVLGEYRPAVDEILAGVNPTSLVQETLAGKVVGRLMKVSNVRAAAAEALWGAPDRSARLRRIRGLTKKNSRWVGPVRVLARGIPHLWPVVVGPLPAAPVAALGLLAWTFLVTGDQLDAAGPYPHLWTGVVGYAKGRT
ncbi:MAG: hypothetical protein HY829_08985 [Actinobacteria bacterium]|nr:hypothetical protein [Actinomycetota bacterium]